MAKFDFNNSKYAGFWESRDAANALRIFVNDPDIITRRAFFWQSQFAVDPLLTTRNYDGTANFSATVRKRSIDNMLDMRAPLAETQPRDKKGISIYTGPIPDFAAKGYVETAMEREARERMFESYFGNDAELVAAYANTIQEMFDEANQTMSNLAAQAISKASVVYNYGTGIQAPIYSAPLPAENKVNAGTEAWTSATCKLLDQMHKIEQNYRDRTGSTIGLKWQIPRDIFLSVVLKNQQVIEYITSWRTVNDKPVVNGWAINEQMFNEAFANNNIISPIEVVEEAQRDGSVGVVHGWASNTVVLRPVGFAGQVKRADILDRKMAEKYGNSIVNEVFSGLDIFTLVNTVCANGKYKEWHTDLLVSAVPVLDELYDHIIVDIATAD